jgi:hypothetical protein
MNAARELIEFHSRSLPLFQPANRLADNLLIHFVDFHATANFGKKRNCQFSSQMFLKVGKTFQHQGTAFRVTLPKHVMPQNKTKSL